MASVPPFESRNKSHGTVYCWGLGSMSPSYPQPLKTTEILFQEVFSLYVLPEDIISDSSVQFTTQQGFCKRLNIRVSGSSGYHPKSNGLTLRLSQEIRGFLNATTANRMGASSFLGLNMHRTPSFTWFLTSHSTMCLGTNLCFSYGFVNLSVCQLWIIWIRLSKHTWDADDICLQRASQWQKRLLDWWQCPHQALQPGQKVWLFTWDLLLKWPFRKLSPQFIGPLK